MMMSKYNQFNAGNFGKNNFLNQNKGINQKYIDAAKAHMNTRHNNMDYGAAKNAYHKNNHYNEYAAAARRKKAANNANSFMANKAMKNKAAMAGTKKSARYKKKNNFGVAARNAHVYGNQYSRKKAIGNIN
jgi:hypothetical protein